MGIKCKVFGLVFGLTVVVVSVLSCGGKMPSFSSTSDEEEQGMGSVEQEVSQNSATPAADTLLFESAPALDGVFNDFLFAYLHSRSLRHARTAKPLRLEHATRPAEMLEDFNPEFELGFLFGEYFTTLYGNTAQMLEEDAEEMDEDSIVSLQRINLNDGTIRNFLFVREKGHWQLATIREETFEDDDLGDFLCFYAQFCSDSLFQTQSVADPLHIVIQDSEDEEGRIDGIIDADQWQSFCPEVPSGIISNIRKGQDYGQNRIVLRKSGLSNGLQEIFTFTRERGNWRLTRYEN